MSRYKKVPVADLIVDHNYQRPLDENRVTRMVKDFRPAMLGALEVARHNGKCAVFDGQHRLAAVKELGHETVPCFVHEGLSQAEEADLFYRLQRDRKAIHPVQAFRARVVAKDEKAIEIDEIVRDAGFAIDFKRGPSTISAVKTIERVYKRGVLPETLELLHLWDGDDGATDGMFIDGVSLLEQGYGHRIGVAERGKLQSVSAVVIARNAMSKQVKAAGWSNAKDRAPFVLTELRKIADLQGRPRGMEKAKAKA